MRSFLFLLLVLSLGCVSSYTRIEEHLDSDGKVTKVTLRNFQYGIGNVSAYSCGNTDGKNERACAVMNGAEVSDNGLKLISNAVKEAVKASVGAP